MLKVLRLSENATLPTRGSPRAAGADLYSAENTFVPARGSRIVKTDIAIVCPDGTYGRVAPRSGLTVKHSIDVGAGVIDADYRGNVGVVFFNHSDCDFLVRIGDRISQLILEKILIPVIEDVAHVDQTQRGEAGFGSTGK